MEVIWCGFLSFEFLIPEEEKRYCTESQTQFKAWDALFFYGEGDRFQIRGAVVVGDLEGEVVCSCFCVLMGRVFSYGFCGAVTEVPEP